ncbi:MAG TPA: hypothetical protein VNW25_01230, partial [Candidatus Sulfotelmatobacter sp.]|nr:hypothetical protein [Candidatus Sulfotelmatobacter sp.]
ELSKPISAMISLSRPLSLADRKFAKKKRGVAFNALATQVPGPGTIKNETLRAYGWSGLLDACLERAGLREDRDLHSEAWVLVTRATDTLKQGLQAKTRFNMGLARGF